MILAPAWTLALVLSMILTPAWTMALVLSMILAPASGSIYDTGPSLWFYLWYWSQPGPWPWLYPWYWSQPGPWPWFYPWYWSQPGPWPWFYLWYWSQPGPWPWFNLWYWSQPLVTGPSLPSGSIHHNGPPWPWFYLWYWSQPLVLSITMAHSGPMQLLLAPPHPTPHHSHLINLTTQETTRRKLCTGMSVAAPLKLCEGLGACDNLLSPASFTLYTGLISYRQEHTLSRPCFQSTVSHPSTHSPQSANLIGMGTPLSHQSCLFSYQSPPSIKELIPSLNEKATDVLLGLLGPGRNEKVKHLISMTVTWNDRKITAGPNAFISSVQRHLCT